MGEAECRDTHGSTGVFGPLSFVGRGVLLLFFVNMCMLAMSFTGDGHVGDWHGTVAGSGTNVCTPFCVLIPCRLWYGEHSSSPSSLHACFSTLHRQGGMGGKMRCYKLAGRDEWFVASSHGEQSSASRALHYRQ